MLDVLNLALPFFGLIFLGYVCGKLKRIPYTGLAWMSFFIIYVALPVLFYRILAKTPFEQLAYSSWRGITMPGCSRHPARSRSVRYSRWRPTTVMWLIKTRVLPHSLFY